MIDEVKVRARKSAKYGKTYEYRFEVAPIGGERKWYSKGGFLSEKEARKAGLEELKRYYACGLPERSSNISYADFLDEWMENDCKYNLKETTLLNYRKRIKNHIKPELGGYQVMRLSTEAEVKKARKEFEKAAKETEKASATAAKEKGKVSTQEEVLLEQIDELLQLQEIDMAESSAKEAVSDLTHSIDEVERQINQISKGLERKDQLDDLIPKKEKELASVEEQLTAVRELLASSGASIQSLTEQIKVLKGKLSFTDKSAAVTQRNALADERQVLQSALEAVEKAYMNCKDNLTALVASAQELKKQLEESPEIDMQSQTEKKDALSTQKAAILKEQKMAHTRIMSNSASRKNIMSKSAELSALEEKQKWLRALSDTANGTIRGKEKIMLETYIQTTYFDRIVARANVRLMKMTGGQYDLKRRKTADTMRGQTGLELDVIDHYNGTERSVKTLSGGESFKASLALALGLSDEVQMSTGIQLDTLFVDEGFGSLDPESLTQAYNTLAGLTEGNRLVGIISHVAELKEKIDKQILVTKEKTGGSKITLQV